MPQLEQEPFTRKTLSVKEDAIDLEAIPEELLSDIWIKANGIITLPGLSRMHLVSIGYMLFQLFLLIRVRNILSKSHSLKPVESLHAPVCCTSKSM